MYGEAATEALYGEPLPIATQRIIEVHDGMALDLAGRILTVIETPGHAKDHISLIDEKTGHVFAGDAFGLSFRELDGPADASVFPITSPTQFDPAAMHASIDRIARIAPGAIYVTHSGRVSGVASLADDLHRLVDACCGVARKLAEESAEQLLLRSVESLRELTRAEMVRREWQLDDDAVFHLLGEYLELNAHGLVAWCDVKRR